MRWIALTGVNGFIGHNLLREFLEQKPQTLNLKVEAVLGADLTGSLERETHAWATAQQNYRFVLAEEILSELARAEDLWDSPPLAVIHNGACSSTTETDPEVFRTLNVESSQQLFHYCSSKKVPFLYASSASVYGDGSCGFSDAVEQNSNYYPMNLYGRSKHQFDTWVLSQKERPPVWFGMRYFNVFGPYEEHKKAQASVLHWGSRQIRESGELKLFKSHREDIADGQQQRDFVSVFDVVRVTLSLLELALQNPDLPERGAFVNVGRGEAATWEETARALFSALGKEVAISYIDMPEQLRAHYQNYTCAELSTLHKLGLTRPFLSLEEGFQKALLQFAENTDSRH
ncbi:MAG: NAD-dependent epimerase/dehydratase family protein [Vulcanimicrobiota bacterium]